MTYISLDWKSEENLRYPDKQSLLFMQPLKFQVCKIFQTNMKNFQCHQTNLRQKAIFCSASIIIPNLQKVICNFYSYTPPFSAVWYTVLCADLIDFEKDTTRDTKCHNVRYWLPDPSPPAGIVWFTSWMKIINWT